MDPSRIKMVEQIRVPLHGQRVASQLVDMQQGVLARYTAQEGDTFVSIARQFYGDEWRGMTALIAAENGLAEEAKIPVGLVLSIPNLGWRVR